MFWTPIQAKKIQKILFNAHQRLIVLRGRRMEILRNYEEQKNKNAQKSIWKKILQL